MFILWWSPHIKKVPNSNNATAPFQLKCLPLAAARPRLLASTCLLPPPSLRSLVALRRGPLSTNNASQLPLRVHVSLLPPAFCHYHRTASLSLCATPEEPSLNYVLQPYLRNTAVALTYPCFAAFIFSNTAQPPRRSVSTPTPASLVVGSSQVQQRTRQLLVCFFFVP